MYMVKTLQKSSSPEQAGRFPRNLVCNIGDSSQSYFFFQMMTWSDLDLFYGKVKFGNLGFFYGKSENSGLSETIAASDLKVGRCRQLIEFMKVYEY